MARVVYVSRKRMVAKVKAEPNEEAASGKCKGEEKGTGKGKGEATPRPCTGKGKGDDVEILSLEVKGDDDDDERRKVPIVKVERKGKNVAHPRRPVVVKVANAKAKAIPD